MTAPRASILIVEHATAAHLPACLGSVLASEAPPGSFEVLVLDNDSPTPIDHLRAAFPSARFFRARRNLGFAGGCGALLAEAGGEIVITVNPDCVVAPDWLARILEVFDDDPKAGVVGCKILHPGTTILQHAGGVLFPNGRSEHRGRGEDDIGQFDELAEVDYVCGAAIAVRRRVIDEVGFLAPEYFPAYFEETELCVRARRAGWRVLYAPRAVVEHHEAVASGGARSRAYLRRYHESRMKFVYRNYGLGRLVREFVPTEAAWLLSGVMPRDERWLCARAYAAALLGAWDPRAGTAAPGEVTPAGEETSP